MLKTHSVKYYLTSSYSFYLHIYCNITFTSSKGKSSIFVFLLSPIPAFLPISFHIFSLSCLFSLPLFLFALPYSPLLFSFWPFRPLFLTDAPLVDTLFLSSLLPPLFFFPLQSNLSLAPSVPHSPLPSFHVTLTLPPHSIPFFPHPSFHFTLTPSIPPFQVIPSLSPLPHPMSPLPLPHPSSLIPPLPLPLIRCQPLPPTSPRLAMRCPPKEVGPNINHLVTLGPCGDRIATASSPSPSSLDITFWRL